MPHKRVEYYHLYLIARRDRDLNTNDDTADIRMIDDTMLHGNDDKDALEKAPEARERAATMLQSAKRGQAARASVVASLSAHRARQL